MTLFELAATLSLDTTKFNQGIRQASDTGQNFANTLSQNVTAKAVALGNALYKAAETGAKALINLGKSAVTAAAEVSAENAQFEAAFGDIQKAAHNVFNAIGRDTNILATRLRGVGTKAFSQFKGAGLEAAEALGMTDKYTRLAADAAAYYDISLEAADERLRSFLRGNTEAGDAIGLFTSESQRNTYAMEQYSKKWQDLTEAQKQMLMLNVAEDIYAQSGAIGQAEREGSNWANTLANLQEAWRQTLAVVGEPFVDAITPFLEGVTSKLNDSTFQASLATVAGKIGEIAGISLEGVLIAVGALLGDLDSINKWEITWDKTIAPSATAGANAIIDAVNTVFGTNIPSISTIDFPSWSDVKSAASAAWEDIRAGMNSVMETTRLVAKVMGFAEWTEEDSRKVTEWWTGVITSVSDILHATFTMDFPDGVPGAIRSWWSQVVKNVGTLTLNIGYSLMPIARNLGSRIRLSDEDIDEAMDAMQGVADNPSGALDQIENMTPSETREAVGTIWDALFNQPKPVDGSYSVGLNYVPRDNFIARLHEGEAVLTKTEATAWRRGEGQGVDVAGIVGAVVQGVREGLRGLAINMDGHAVGDLVTEQVSRNIAQAAWAGRYSG